MWPGVRPRAIGAVRCAQFWPCLISRMTFWSGSDHLRPPISQVSKSRSLRGVWVRPPPPAPTILKHFLMSCRRRLKRRRGACAGVGSGLRRCQKRRGGGGAPAASGNPQCNRPAANPPGPEVCNCDHAPLLYLHRPAPPKPTTRSSLAIARRSPRPRSPATPTGATAPRPSCCGRSTAPSPRRSRTPSRSASRHRCAGPRSAARSNGCTCDQAPKLRNAQTP